MRRLALPLAAAMALGGCGGAEREAPAGGGGSVPAGDVVTVVVFPDGEGGAAPERRKLVDCRGTASDSDRCERLARTDFRPPPPGVACTEVHGGPATALVTGRVGGRRVDERFSLENGCAISRWEDFAWLLGDPPQG